MAYASYRRVKVEAAKYADVHGDEDLVDNIKYKWKADGTGPVGIDGPINVMGQEDLFREDVEGHRVDNPGTARIVFSTSVSIKRFEIFYTFDTNEYNRRTGIITLPYATQFVEYFLTPVTVSAEYKFMVRVYSAFDDEDYLDSLDYWFTTQGRTGITSTGFITEFNFGEIQMFEELEVTTSLFAGAVIPDSPKGPGLLMQESSSENLGQIYLSVSHTNPPIVTIVSHVFI